MGFIGEFIGSAHLLNTFRTQVIKFADQGRKAGRRRVHGGFFVNSGCVCVAHGLTVAVCQQHQARAKKKH
jgi:hypothetical protein